MPYDRLYVEERVGIWEIGTLYGSNMLLDKDELLKLAHMLIKAYRRESQKEEAGI